MTAGVSPLNSVFPSVSASYAVSVVRPRILFRTLHLLIGLSFGLLLAIQGMSGSVLVWRPELDRLVLPKSAHAAGPRGSLNDEFVSVRQVAPQGIVRMVRLAQAPTGSDEWSLAFLGPGSPAAPNAGARWTVYVAPSTAKILGIRGPQRDVLAFLVELHHNLLMGPLGRGGLGYLAIATILLALTGLWLWWPKRWTWSRIRPRAEVKPLHYSVGFWAMPPLLLIATTALYFVWRQPIQRAFGIADAHVSETRPAGGQGRRKAARGRDDSQSQAQPVEPSLDSIIAMATGAVSSERAVALRFPEKPGGEFSVLFEPPDRHYRAAPDSVSVRVLPDGRPQLDSISLWNQMPLRRRFLEWLPRIHQAEVGGFAIRIIWSIAGWMPAVLYLSGFLMWRRGTPAAKNSSPQTGAGWIALQQEPGGHVGARRPQPTGGLK